MKTRFAPSPTGGLHTGGARTALFNWLFARASGGVFVLRIDDTDVERSEAELEAGLMDDLRWLGLDWDEGPDIGGPTGPYRQSERLEIYSEYAEKLLAGENAYRCYCTRERLDELKRDQEKKKLPPRYDGRCRGAPPEGVSETAPHVVRFAVPEGERIVVMDGVYSETSYDTSDLGDFVIVTSAGRPTYNLASAVDDPLMGITHVIRGEDHASNTPRQMLIMDALGFELPAFAHLPLVHGPDGKPLSKREGGGTVSKLRGEGHLPGAVVNGLARLGWSPPEGFHTLAELTRDFDVVRLSRSPSVFEPSSLRKYGHEAMSRAAAEELRTLLPEGVRDASDDAIEAAKEDAATTEDLAGLLAPFAGPLPDDAERPGPGDSKVLKALRGVVEDMDRLDADAARRALKDVSEKTGAKGKGLFMPVRLALTGSRKGLDLPRVMELLGRNAVLERLASEIGRAGAEEKVSD